MCVSSTPERPETAEADPRMPDGLAGELSALLAAGGGGGDGDSEGFQRVQDAVPRGPVNIFREEDPRLEKIARLNAARILENLSHSVSDLTVAVYHLDRSGDQARYASDMQKHLSDKTIVITEGPIQYIPNPAAEGGVTVLVVVKTARVLPEVKGIDRQPITGISSPSNKQ